MLNTFILLFITISVLPVSGQNAGKMNDNDFSCEAHLDSLINKEVYSITEEMPQPNGGMSNLYGQLSKHINFPRQKFERMGVEPSKIFLGFVVDVDGSIIGQRIIKNIERTDVAEQMFDIISNITWTPGYCNKNPVPVILIIPIQICLR